MTASVPVPSLAIRPGIPFVRLDNADAELLAELTGAVSDVAARAAFTLGEEVDAFENEFAAYCGTDHCIGVSSGTEAIVLALRALDIGPGDEVIVPTNSFIATAEAVSLTGATPRLVDVDDESGLVTPELIEAALNPNTRCVIPVHLYGATADMPAITRLARRAGIAVVEDACQAHGAWIEGRRVGSFGDLGCFSFYPTKNLGGWGDGGAVVSGDARLAERVRLLRSHGEPAGERNRHRLVGTTARLDAIQAAVLRIKLRRLDAWNEARRQLAEDLRARLAATSVRLPSRPTRGDHVHHLFVVRVPSRDRFRERLAREGIATAVHYPVPMHRCEAYASLSLGCGSLPVSERRSETICSLPFFPAMREEELERLARAVAQSL